MESKQKLMLMILGFISAIVIGTAVMYLEFHQERLVVYALYLGIVSWTFFFQVVCLIISMLKLNLIKKEAMGKLILLIGLLFGMSLTGHFFFGGELVAIRHRYASTLPNIQFACFAGRMAIIITVLNIVLLVTLIALYKQKSLETGATPTKQLD